MEPQDYVDARLRALLEEANQRIHDIEQQIAEAINPESLTFDLTRFGEKKQSSTKVNQQVVGRLEGEIRAIRVETLSKASKDFNSPDTKINQERRNLVVGALFPGQEFVSKEEAREIIAERKDFVDSQEWAIFGRAGVFVEKAKEPVPDKTPPGDEISQPDVQLPSQKPNKLSSMSARFFQSLPSHPYYNGGPTDGPDQSPTPEPKGPEDDLI